MLDEESDGQSSFLSSVYDSDSEEEKVQNALLDTKHLLEWFDINHSENYH